MRTPILVLSILATSALFLASGQAQAFCGFYVAKADTKLFNEASKVVLARSGNRTVITMVNDYKGEPKEFALVVPIPRVLDRDQIHVAETAGVDHVSLGSDYDGAVSAPVDVSGLAVFTEALLKQGFSEEDVGKVMGENGFRILRHSLT